MTCVPLDAGFLDMRPDSSPPLLHVLRLSGEPVEILHVEENAHGRRILAQTTHGKRLLLREIELAAWRQDVPGDERRR